MHGTVSLMHHYRNMAVSHWKKHIEGNPEPKLKKYLYMIRPVAMLCRLIDAARSGACSVGEADFDINFLRVVEGLRRTSATVAEV